MDYRHFRHFRADSAENPENPQKYSFYLLPSDYLSSDSLAYGLGLSVLGRGHADILLELPHKAVAALVAAFFTYLRNAEVRRQQQPFRAAHSAVDNVLLDGYSENLGI